MTNPVLSVLAAVARRSKADFIRKTHHLEKAQETFLRSLLQAHQNTEFGRSHHLSEIKTIDQFRERIPVQPYRHYDPYAQRMANGEPNILTPDPLIYINLSSGSTGHKKFIPVTKRSRRFLSRASRTAMGFLVDAAKREGLPLGKMLLPLSVKPLGYTSSGIAYAPGSTSDLRLMDNIYRQVFTYPFEAVQISDTLARYYICLLFALRNSTLRVIAATFPVLALQLCDYLEQNAEDLIQDLETGEIANWLKLEPELRAKLERQWSAAPERADQLRYSLKTHGQLTPQAAWQNLSFLITARGGTSNFYFDRFPGYFGNIPIFGGTYACAEGVLGIHRDFDTDSAILAIDNGFFEFIPEDQWDVEYPKTLLPWEVKRGDRYRIVFTNYSGFYRYDLGDIVEIDGFFERTPLIIFRHRRGGILSSSTEKTTEFHVIQVMQILQQAFDVVLKNFCITLSKEAIPSHYLVNIELTSGSTLPDPERFLQKFDDTLKEVHAFYAIKRRDQIPLPRLRILESGSFAKFRQQMIQRGVAEAQLKFPHVSEDRNLLDDLAIEREIRLAGD
ncbi:MAG: GH3 auxin-responsive promoter family protein [Cyanobacteria bacterium CRU_2_1]|nr:GH3 auxin-responsive promoter family protein [Cyanobacteria bacterium CRU_2_1]